MTANALSPEDHRRLSEAIQKAEANTAGEIYVVVAKASDDYFYPAAFMLTIGSVVASLVAALLLEFLWISVRTPMFLAVEALALGLAVALVAAMPSLRHHLVPRRLRYRRAHDNAVKQFLARNVHVTAARTGVLIFVSLAERYAEVIADAGIDRHVDDKAWTGIVARLTEQAGAGRLADGLLDAIAEAGALLATHVPPRPGDINELSDHVVEI